jgi:polysaccharide biosynthesis transport protein
MLDRLHRTALTPDPPLAIVDAAANTFNLESALAAARRQFKVVALTTAAVILLAVGYIVAAVPIYTSTVEIFIDGRQFGAVDISRDPAGLTFNSNAIDSQVEVLKSEKIALSVISKLNLTEDPEFTSPSFIKELISKTIERLQFSRAGADAQIQDEQLVLQRRALEKFQNELEVKRVEKTFVLNVEFSSRGASKAAAIANAIADEYLRDHLDAKYDATRRASGWLQERLEELQQKLFEAELAVARFKEDNKLIGARGSLVNEQQLAQVTSQLSSARAETARTRARYELIQSIIQSGKAEAAVSEELNSPVMIDLRNKYLKVAKRAEQLGARVGQGHFQVGLLREEMQQYEKQMFEELGRIAETYRSDMEIARSREKSLTENLATSIGANAGDNVTLVSLRAGERKAESLRILYQNFLQRYQETTHQQSFPITEARVITAATRSLWPSKPPKLLVMAISVAGGLCLGAGLGMLREYRDLGLRTSDQVRDLLGLEFLGIIPRISTGPLMTGIGPELLRVVVDSPLSKFADAIRTAKVAVDLVSSSAGASVVGVVSAVAGEGKSTISANLAMLLGSVGSPTLLVDGDLRQAGLTKAIGIETGRSLAFVGTEPISALVTRLPESNVWFLPCSLSAKTPNSSQVLGSKEMDAFLKRANEYFQYVIIDLPPLEALVDAKAIAPLVDSFLFVIEWGKTPRGVVEGALVNNEPVNRKCAGAVLNKADLGLLPLYKAYGTHDYDNGC